MMRRIFFVAFFLIIVLASIKARDSVVVVKDINEENNRNRNNNSGNSGGIETNPISTTPLHQPTPFELSINEGSPESTKNEPKLQMESDDSNKRRQITYDQRQEGQYNIRADLENFMIVVIPPNPVVGVNLLDILTRSASEKRSQLKKLSKKHHGRGGTVGKHIGSNLQKINNHPQHQTNYDDRVQQQNDGPAARFNEFIEGRTPYKVDISSSGEADFAAVVGGGGGTRIPSDVQVDVLPPPWHMHLMKPYNEAELVIPESPSVLSSPSSIGSLISSTSAQQGKFLEVVGRFSNSRIGKAIRDHLDLKDLHNNRLSITGNLGGGRTYNQKRDIDDEELPLIASEKQTYVDLDDTIYPLDSINLGGYDAYNTRAIENLHEDGNGGNWELKLLGANEQCGPDRRRDSYGICQFVSADLI